MLPPLGGGFDFAGSPVDYRSEASLSRLYAKIGVLYQDGALLNGLNLYENAASPRRGIRLRRQSRRLPLRGLAQPPLRQDWSPLPGRRPAQRAEPLRECCLPSAGDSTSPAVPSTTAPRPRSAASTPRLESSTRTAPCSTG